MKKFFFVCAIFASANTNAKIVFFNNEADFNLTAKTNLIETFDDLFPTDTTISSPLVRGIATYSSLYRNLVVTGANTTYDNFGSVLNPFKGSVLTANGPENINVTFSSQLYAVGFDAYLNGLGNTTINVYQDSTLLQTLDLSNINGGGKVFVGIVSDTSFNVFQWASTGGGVKNSAIDSIRVAAIPEPSSYALILLGLGAIACLSLRRRFQLKMLRVC